MLDKYEAWIERQPLHIQGMLVIFGFGACFAPKIISWVL